MVWLLLSGLSSHHSLALAMQPLLEVTGRGSNPQRRSIKGPRPCGLRIAPSLTVDFCIKDNPLLCTVEKSTYNQH